MRVVLDCNVIVSAARSPGGTCAEVVVETARQHELVTSAPIVREYRSVALRPRHAKYRDGLLALIAELERVATVVAPADAAFGLQDPDDEVYLQTALAGMATLVTGNTRHFPSSSYGSVDVRSPRRFLEESCMAGTT